MYILESELNTDLVFEGGARMPSALNIADRIAEFESEGVFVSRLYIDPLKVGWNSRLAPNHFRSGCAPIEALQHAKKIMSQGVQAVLIEGEDFLRSDSDYANRNRQKLMDIYGGVSIPEAYTQLAMEFLSLQNISQQEFLLFSQTLFENQLRTARSRGLDSALNLKVSSERFKFATELFRYVDCANPVVDFCGRLLLVDDGLARKYGSTNLIRVAGVCAQTGDHDGPDHVQSLAHYDSLKNVVDEASALAGIDFRKRYLDGKALLEAYTCFPIVPLAFFLVGGFAKNLSEAMCIVKNLEVTVTGGMNLARAPWNNPALHALIVMAEQLKSRDIKWGAVHTNGGLGYKQGFAILENVTSGEKLGARV